MRILQITILAFTMCMLYVGDAHGQSVYTATHFGGTVPIGVQPTRIGERSPVGQAGDIVPLYSTDRDNPFMPGMEWMVRFTSLASNDLEPTRFEDVIGYRKAWYTSTFFESRGEACRCWLSIQNTMWSFTGSIPVSPDIDFSLRSTVDTWYTNIGQFANWENVWIVTAEATGADNLGGNMEFMTGAVSLRPIPPVLPPAPPVTPVPEPGTWALLLSGLAVLGFFRFTLAKPQATS